MSFALLKCLNSRWLGEQLSTKKQKKHFDFGHFIWLQFDFDSWCVSEWVSECVWVFFNDTIANSPCNYVDSTIEYNPYIIDEWIAFILLWLFWFFIIIFFVLIFFFTSAIYLACLMVQHMNVFLFVSLLFFPLFFIYLFFVSVFRSNQVIESERIQRIFLINLWWSQKICALSFMQTKSPKKRRYIHMVVRRRSVSMIQSCIQSNNYFNRWCCCCLVFLG